MASRSSMNLWDSASSSKNSQSGSFHGGNSSASRAQSYDSQASNSASRGPSSASQASNSASRGPSSASQASNSASGAQSYDSQASNSVSQASNSVSQASNSMSMQLFWKCIAPPPCSASQASNSASQASNSASRASNSASRASNSASRGQSSASQASNSASRSSNSASRGQSSASQASNSASRGQSSASQASNSASQASNSASRSSNSATRGQSSVSKASNSASRGQSSASQASNGPVKYGELSVLGDSSTKSHFTLYKRPKANGLKPSTVHKGSDKSINISGMSCMTFVTPVTTVIVEYTEDRNTDMFQIGRSTGGKNDYVLADTEVSRFACRIICQRSPPYTAHIYAAGFDSDKNIFLGLDTVKWESRGQLDGLTTNGVLVMQPLPGFTPGPWREISVCGSVLTPRDSPKTKGKRVGSEQELEDGTLIDLCGVTLLWRTTERPIKNLAAMLKNSPRY